MYKHALPKSRNSRNRNQKRSAWKSIWCCLWHCDARHGGGEEASTEATHGSVQDGHRWGRALWPVPTLTFSSSHLHKTVQVLRVMYNRCWIVGHLNIKHLQVETQAHTAQGKNRPCCGAVACATRSRLHGLQASANWRRQHWGNRRDNNESRPITSWGHFTAAGEN